MSTLRNIKVGVTAETSNLEQGMRRAEKSVTSFARSAERSSQLTGNAFDNLGKKSEGINKGLGLATVAAFRLGGSFDSMSGSIAKGIGDTIAMTKAFGPLGLAFGAVTSAIDIFSSANRRAREESERAAAAARAQAAEQAKQDDAYRSSARAIREQVEMLQARNAAEERAIRAQRERAKLVEQHGEKRGGTLADLLEGAQEARIKREDEAAFLKALKEEEDAQRRIAEERAKQTAEYRLHLRDRQLALDYDEEFVRRLKEREYLDDVEARTNKETALWEENILKTERERKATADAMAEIQRQQLGLGKAIAKAAQDALKAEEAAVKKAAAEREKMQADLDRDAENKRAAADNAWMRRDQTDANLRAYDTEDRKRRYQTSRLGGYFDDVGDFVDNRRANRDAARAERRSSNKRFEAASRRGSNIGVTLDDMAASRRRQRIGDPQRDALAGDAADASSVAAKAEEAAQAAEKAANAFRALEAPMQGISKSAADTAATAAGIQPHAQTAADNMGKTNDALVGVSTSMQQVSSHAAKQGQIIQQLKTDVDALKQALSWVQKAA